jgi:hypothetical protein
VTVKDFYPAAKAQIKGIPKNEHDNTTFCILCLPKINAIKAKTTTAKFNINHSSDSIVAKAPCKRVNNLLFSQDQSCASYADWQPTSAKSLFSLNAKKIIKRFHMP